MAAKTGTSEKKERECPLCDSVGNPKKVDGVLTYVCSICGYEGEMDEFAVSEDYVCSTVAFAPADDPKYAIIIIVDEPTKGLLYGSTVAAPYVANVLETVLPYLGVEAVYSDAEMSKKTVKIPNCSDYWSGSYAKKYCEAAPYNLKVEFVGDPGGIVYKQWPEAGTVVEKENATIVLYTDKTAAETLVTVPNVVDMSALAANQTLINAGLNIRIEGTKNYSGSGVRVVEQSIPAGTQVPRGTVIEVRFLYVEGDG